MLAHHPIPRLACVGPGGLFFKTDFTYVLRAVRDASIYLAAEAMESDDEIMSANRHERSPPGTPTQKMKAELKKMRARVDHIMASERESRCCWLIVSVCP